MKMVLKSGQECFLVGSSFPGKGGTYQKVQVRKMTTSKGPGPSGYNSKMPGEEKARERIRQALKPYPSLLHELTVRQGSIKQVKEKPLAG